MSNTIPQNKVGLNCEDADAQQVAEAPNLSERDRHRLLCEWNDTKEECPDACVHELFEQRVARDPDAVAVVFKERQLSYRELNNRANQVAHFLRKNGVGPEILVGVCLERSPEMVIALLGVWKSGGAYVPLDPSYPRERLSFMFRDAHVQVSLTEREHRNLFPSSYDNAVCLDSDWPVIAQESSTNLAAVAMPSTLAYVMYTSGSTGQPKGVMIQHSGLANYLCWAIKAYEVKGKVSIPIHSSISFDSTVASLFPPLLTGGQIELLPENVGAQGLLAAAHQARTWSKIVITPAHLELLNQQLSPKEMAGMTKVLVLAGESLPAECLSKWRDSAPATRLFNEYGPTETTVGCCAYEVKAKDPRNGPVPIGKPIANTRLYVLDANLHLVPPGAIGELYIGGAGVGRGYLNRPELTRERFLVDPFSGQSRSRLYKTGDLARYRNDGTLEFLGRSDDQVKIRGYRIELGEIEAALAGHVDVQSCVVVARENTPTDRKLVGYVIPRNNELLDAEGLRNFLRQRLPEYMVPAHFVLLESFPLTHNGKLDRNALPPPSYENVSAHQKFIAPRTEAEKKLAAIWTELLGVKCIGIHDDFFDWGGNSVLAIKAMAQIQKEFGVVINLQTMFPTATVAKVAQALEGREKFPSRFAYAVPIQSGGKQPILFCAGLGRLLRPLSIFLGSEQPLFSIGLTPEAVERLNAPYNMEELARHLISAIYEKQPHGPYYLSGFCQDAIFAYETARQMMIDGQTVGLLVLFEPDYPSQRARDRIATIIKRFIIRVRFHLGELYRLGIKGFSLYARNRREDFKRWMKHLSWLIEHRLRPLKHQAVRDLEQINFISATSYKPELLACPTVIFRCKDYPIISAGDPYFGWREFLTGRCETYEVPGDHMGMFSEPNAKVLADQLRACLHNSRQTGGPTR